MRIAVPIKQVPETADVKMDERTGTMMRDSVEAIVNPLDLYAIAAAIRIRESLPAGECELVAVSMGPPSAARALREAIAMGIDSAVLVSDKAFAGSDTWATSYVLAAAIRKLGPCEMIICGERATDGDTGQVGPGIAAWLDLPAVTYVGRIESVHDGLCRVRRLVADGHELLDMSLPGLLTVVKEVASPRLPTLGGKLRAKQVEIPHWSAGDLAVRPDRLGLDGSPTRVVKIFRPTVTRRCHKVAPTDQDAIDAAAGSLADALADRGLL